MRVAAVADLHCTKTSQGKLAPLLAQVAGRADALVLGGDLTDYGLPEEAHVLARELATAKIPTVAVLGNHDFESGKQDEVKRILVEAGVNVLDGDAVEIEGVGFAGVKGFAGGFGERTLGPWGEEAIKRFVQEAVDEALKLEAALARLRTAIRVAVLHYAPIEATVRGEPPPIFPFLGSSRLEEPIDRYHVRAVFHGHAHSGTAEGRTKAGIPVYNVSLPLLRRTVREGEPPVRFLDVAEPLETREVAA
ncbi:MAG TPA: metallophosphoesterase [Candidatus Limnocylindria bacterium]